MDHDAAGPSPGLEPTAGQEEPGSQRPGAARESSGSGSQAVEAHLWAGDVEERSVRGSDGAGSAGSGGVDWKARQTLRAQVRC